MKIISGSASIQGSPEWHAWRREGIGASDAPIIMGKSYYMRAYELFRLKTGNPIPQKKNKILDQIRERGRRMEPLARAAYEKLTGKVVVPITGCSEIYPFIRASFDGYDAFTSVPVEIKCPGLRAHQLAQKGIVPEEYVDQLQHQLFVAGAEFAHYYSFDGSDGVLIVVPRDDKRIMEIVEAERWFWEKVTSGKWDSDQWKDALAAWMLSKRDLEEAKEREELARETISSLLPESGTHEQMGVLITRGTRKGSVDISKLLAGHGIDINDVDLDRYRDPPSTQMRITTCKGLDISDFDLSRLNLSPNILTETPSGSPDMTFMDGVFGGNFDLDI